MYYVNLTVHYVSHHACEDGLLKEEAAVANFPLILMTFDTNWWNVITAELLMKPWTHVANSVEKKENERSYRGSIQPWVFLPTLISMGYMFPLEVKWTNPHFVSFEKMAFKVGMLHWDTVISNFFDCQQRAIKNFSDDATELTICTDPQSMP